MFDRVIVATDGSAHAEMAVRVAARLADPAARLVLLHVIAPGPLDEDMRRLAETEHLAGATPPEPFVYEIAGVPDWMRETLRAAGSGAADRQLLESIAGQVLQRAATLAREAGAQGAEPVIEHGDPARRILDVVQREKANLVVVGHRGLSNFAGLLFGSVSGRVAQLAPCTCISVR